MLVAGQVLTINSETVGATALGAVTGAIFGNLAQKNALYNSRVGRLYSNDDYRRTAPAFFEIRKGIDTGLAKIGGSAASILNTMAEVAPTARKLGQTFVDDFEKKLTGPRATRRIDYSFAEDLDNRRAGYIQGLDAALEPVRKTGSISPVDELNIIRILRGAKPETKNNKLFLNNKEISSEVVSTADRLRKIFDSVYKHADDANMAPEYVENWFARSWSREAIEADPKEFKRLLTKQRTKNGQKYKIVEPNQVDDVVTGMLNKQDELYASHSHLLGQARTFKDLPDNEFEKFLTNDLVEVSSNYLLNAARSIEIKKNFLSSGKPVKISGKTAEGNLILYKQSLEDQFRERYVNKIKDEIREAGGRFTGNDEKKIVDLFNSVTGNVSYYGDTVQALYDGMKLANSMAYLPLATLSSVTEAIIPLAKAKPSSAVKGAFDGLTKGHKIFTKEIGQILKDKYKMSDDQLIREMNSVWIGVDEAMGDVTNRLAGEGLQNEFTKRMAKGFFRFNLLIPWTKSVQLASFSTGKDLIYDNLTKLNKLVDNGINVLDDDALIRKAIADAPDKGRLKGIMDSVSKTGAKDNLSRINHLKSELFELGIDVKDGLRWVGQGAKQNDNFYRQVVRGAGRFTNSVILQTGRERAKVPTYMSNPKWDILTQFLRYPYVFSNTILKNFARDTIQNPGVNAPRVAVFGLMATNVALATNYWRSPESYQKQIDKEGVSYRDVVKALQRTGMAGPIDIGIRWGEASRYGKNPLVSAASLGGPVIGDVVNMAIYDRGLLETGARKLPLYGSKNLIKRYTGFDYDTVVQAAKKVDEPIKEQRDKLVEALSLPRRKTYYKGGDVSKDVTDVTDNPANRIDPLTGLPYSAQTDLFTTEFKERKLFNIGGIVDNTGYKELSDKEAEQFKIKLKANAFAPEEKDKVFDTLINTIDKSLRPRQTNELPEIITETKPVFSKKELKEKKENDKKFNNYLNRMEVVNYLKQKGEEYNPKFSKNAIVGIAANIDVETGGTYDYQQKQKNGPGYGLFQLDPTGPLPRAYEEYRKEKNIKDSVKAQIDFMYETIYGDRKYRDKLGYGHGNALQKVFEEGTPEDVTLEFMKRWENPGEPHTNKRLKAAAELTASKAIKVMYD